MKGLRVCRLSYIEAQEDAARRMKKGQRQTLRKCGYWHWQNEKCSGHVELKLPK